MTAAAAILLALLSTASPSSGERAPPETSAPSDAQSSPAAPAPHAEARPPDAASAAAASAPAASAPAASAPAASAPAASPANAADDPPSLSEIASRAAALVSGVRPRALLQLRLDGGDLLSSRSGRRNDMSQDIYFRRARVGADGNGPAGLRFFATLDADHAGEAGRAATARLKDAAIEWRTEGGALTLRGGKAKLPYTRIGLTSSGVQLFVDRPQFIEFARDLFDDFTPLNLLARARAAGGALEFHAALADGWSVGQRLRASGPGSAVRSSLPLGVLRIEAAPPGWIERERSDAHLGEGRHLQVGLSFAGQARISYADADAREARSYLGADVSFHLRGLTAQLEGGEARVRSTLAARGDVRSRGFYAQAGYYLSALRLEPAARFEGWDQDVRRPGARVEAITGGVNAYVLGHGLKASANWIHRWLGPRADGRLADAPREDVVELLLQLRV